VLGFGGEVEGGAFVEIGLGDLWLRDGEGWAGDAGFVVGVDGREGAKLEAADVGEDGGAARGDVVVSEEDIEVAEGVVDALGGLKALVTCEEGGFEVEGVGSLELLGVGETEGSAGGYDTELATAAGGPAPLAAVRVAGGDGVSRLRFGVFEFVHFFLQIGDEGYTPPRVFFVRVANKGDMVDAASRASRNVTRLKVEPSRFPSRLGVNSASS
jgi:hypothetical protein